MFSFHKPKVYRSSTGCCICKAKSSSSRFTDSKKYEEDFLECFQLVAPRQGEICNACVLLVKRWKKLPAGSDRNWRHVVDARAGPGMKSMTKFKSKNKKPSERYNTCAKIEKIMKKKKRIDRESSPALSDRSESKEDVELMEVDFMAEGGNSGGSSCTASPGGSDCEDNGRIPVSRRHKAQAKRRENLPEISGFVDLNFWKPEKVCCGTIFKGPNDEVLIDPRFLKPCAARLANLCKNPTEASTEEKTAVEQSSSKLYSDSSSDSGYDESSNPGVEKENSFVKKDEYLVKDEISISPIGN